MIYCSRCESRPKGNNYCKNHVFIPVVNKNKIAHLICWEGYHLNDINSLTKHLYKELQYINTPNWKPTFSKILLNVKTGSGNVVDLWIINKYIPISTAKYLILTLHHTYLKVSHYIIISVTHVLALSFTYSFRYSVYKIITDIFSTLFLSS